jgi:hypothetical protein
VGTKDASHCLAALLEMQEKGRGRGGREILSSFSTHVEEDDFEYK